MSYRCFYFKVSILTQFISLFVHVVSELGWLHFNFSRKMKAVLYLLLGCLLSSTIEASIVLSGKNWFPIFRG